MANLHSPKLNAQFVRTAKPGKYTDGHGLMLWVKPSGARSWVQRIVIHGKRRDIGLGAFPLVTLAEAREIAFANRKIARAGSDPREQRQATAPSFEDATRSVHAIHAPSWKNDRQRAQWLDEVKRIVWPAIGHLPVDVITTGQLTAVFGPIWLSTPVVASRVRQRTEKILDWAISQGYMMDNPAAAPLKANLPKQPKGEHHKALHHREVANAIRATRASTSGDNTKLAFEFIVLTAARLGEVLNAQWDEFDLDARTWTIPGARMKANRAHRVPLSNRAIEILKATGTNRTGLVFISPRGRKLDDKTIRAMLAKAGVNASIHGFRSSFRDWCSDTGKAREVAEMALAHIVANKTEAAYARSDLFDRRVEMMEQWGGYVTA